VEELEHYQQYMKEAEKIMDTELGEGRFKEFQALTEEQFEALLKELAEGADLVADERDESEFPIHLAPEFIRKLSLELANYAKVPLSIPFLTIATTLSAALGKNLRIQSAQRRFVTGNIYSMLFVSSGVAKSEVFREAVKPLTDRDRRDREARKKMEPFLKADLENIQRTYGILAT
jgi:hypothetical protein